MILYYSGTGNSARAAGRISERTGDAVLNLFDRIRSGDCSALESGRPWIIAVPTYCWRIPRIVEEWLLRTELRGSREAYFIMTCGDDIGNAARYVRALCRKKGLRLRGCAAIVMPENYIAMFHAPGPEEARRIIAAADRKLDGIGEIVAAGGDLPEEPVRPAGRICSGPVNPLFYRLFVRDKKFFATEACIGCGLCERSCPLGNIRIEGGKPTWHGSCTHCMACICSCPKEAIEYGRASAGKLRYTCPED